MAYQSQAQLARNALGRASWKHRADLSHPEVLAARRALESALAQEHIRALVDAAPVLTDEQIAELRALLPA
jgi:hypothetical protein